MASSTSLRQTLSADLMACLGQDDMTDMHLIGADGVKVPAFRTILASWKTMVRIPKNIGGVTPTSLLLWIQPFQAKLGLSMFLDHLYQVLSIYQKKKNEDQSGSLLVLSKQVPTL